MNSRNKLIKKATEYYTKKLNEHGPTHRGLDWNSKESQDIRFDQLLKVIECNESFSILDYGCGYGALYPYMLDKFIEFDFYGYDTSNAMIEKALELYCNTNSNWFTKLEKINKTDYVIASGVFNVKFNILNNHWNDYVIDTLESINKISNKGFSFNLLSKYSDKSHMKYNLFYADPLYLFDYCKMNFSRNIALLHDYSLYEFTILVRKGK